MHAGPEPSLTTDVLYVVIKVSTILLLCFLYLLPVHAPRCQLLALPPHVYRQLQLFANQASATAEQHWKRRVYNKKPFFLLFRWNTVPYNTEAFEDNLWRGLMSVFTMPHGFMVLYLEHRQSTPMITFCFTGIMRQHSDSVDNTITLKQDGLYASF